MIEKPKTDLNTIRRASAPNNPSFKFSADYLRRMPTNQPFKLKRA